MDAAERQKPQPGELFLDHVSHFVRDLDAAAGLLEQLGFMVAPVSIQEVAGSRVGANRCVMLEQGYIEILTPALKPDPGLRLACFGTPDAEAEHRRLADHGFAPQPIVDLQRGLDSETVRFKVVLPGAGKMPEGRVQYVQHLTPQYIWREEYLGHANGVTQLRALFVVADDPPQAAARWARFAGLLPQPDGDMIGLEPARGHVRIGSQEALAKLLGDVPPAPALAGYALGCRHPEEFAARCSRAGLAVENATVGISVALPPELGGIWLLRGESV
jgi:hypothetical protein